MSRFARWFPPIAAPALLLACADDSGGGVKGAEMPVLSVKSTAFEPGAAIPAKHTCDGEDISPPLTWSSGPAGTRTYALIMDDPDAPSGTFVHWVAWNLSASELPEGAGAAGGPGPAGGMQGTNSWKRTSYGGPCPPSGTHRYFFKVYALDLLLDLPASTTKDDLTRAMAGHVLVEGELMGRYARQKR